MPPSRYAIGAVTPAKLTMNVSPSRTFSPGRDVRDRLDDVAPEADRTRLEFGLGDLRAARRAPATGGTAASELIDLPPPR